MPNIYKDPPANSKVLPTVAKLEVRKALNKLHPRDRARYVFERDLGTRRQFYELLNDGELADLIENVDTVPRRAAYLRELGLEHAARVLNKIHIDDAVDILSIHEKSKADEYLALMPTARSQKMRALLKYHKETAGSLMTTEFISVLEGTTATEALDTLKSQANEAEIIYYIYVVDKQHTLKRVITMKELILAEDDESVDKLGKGRVIKVKPDTPKRLVSRQIADYDLLALPVVSNEGQLIGVITIDDALDVIHARGVDRYAKLAAVSNVEITDNPFASAFKRLPWLILLLFLGMVTATLIGQFEDTIAKVAILGAFIPVIAGTTGNSGTQSLAIVVRGIATGKLDKISLSWYYAKEFVTALTTSVISGIVLAGIIFVWKSSLVIGLVAGGSLALSILVGTLAGTAVPLIIRKFHLDPAVASGPLITTICDVISMAIYFTVATLLLSSLM